MPDDKIYNSYEEIKKIMRNINLIKTFSNLNLDNKFKLYRDLWKQSEQYKVLTDFPLHLDIELAGICNLKCKDCFQNDLITKPLGLMDINLFKQIIDEGVKNGLCAIKLQVRGESFLHPNLFECINYAKQKGVIDVQITTNGTILNDSIIDNILSSGLDAIIFSVDPHHKNSFERSKFKYQSIEQNIIKLLALRKDCYSKSKIWVRIQSAINNFDEDMYIKTKDYLNKKFFDADIIVVNRIRQSDDDKDAYQDLKTNYILAPCTYLTQRLTIFWNGDTTTCCMDYNNRFNLGNIKKISIKNIWLSEKMNNFRKMHIEGKRMEMSICKHCHACIRPKNNKKTVNTNKRHFADL